MKVLIDADLILELLINESDIVKETEMIWKLAESQDIEAFITNVGLEKISFYCRELSNEQDIYNIIFSLEKVLSVCNISQSILRKASSYQLRDFESAVELTCVKDLCFDGIVTHCLENFSSSELLDNNVFSVDQLVKKIEENKRIKIQLQSILDNTENTNPQDESYQSEGHQDENHKLKLTKPCDLIKKTILLIMNYRENKENFHKRIYSKEAQEIDEVLGKNKNCNCSDSKEHLAKDFEYIDKALENSQPQIVHFSYRNEELENLELIDKAKVFTKPSESFLSEIKCIILNDCDFETQIEDTKKYFPYVIGVKEQVTNKVVIEFTKAFYRSLSNNYSIKAAYEVSCEIIESEYKISKNLLAILYENTHILHRKN